MPLEMAKSPQKALASVSRLGRAMISRIEAAILVRAGRGPDILASAARPCKPRTLRFGPAPGGRAVFGCARSYAPADERDPAIGSPRDPGLARQSDRRGRRATR